MMAKSSVGVRSRTTGKPRLQQLKLGRRDRLDHSGAEQVVVAHVIRMCQLESMPKMIQVRNVPDELHRELVRRAKAKPSDMLYSLNISFLNTQRLL